MGGDRPGRHILFFEVSGDQVYPGAHIYVSGCVVP
jgi:hypothetical protein